MKPYVKDLLPNEEVTSFFFIFDPPQVRKSKKGADYLCLKLFDKTGEIDARLWEIPKDLDVSALRKCVVKVRGQVTEWNDQLQLNISQIRLARTPFKLAYPELTSEPGSQAFDDVDVADFFERSERDPEEMWSELMSIVEDVQNNYIRELLFAVLSNNAENYKRAPAAKSVHHAYIGGLLEHVLSACRASLLLCERYALNKSLMIAACILHDLGKIREFSYDMGIGYTVEGTLLGHISIGLIEINAAINSIENFPKDLKVAILHLVASHHGLLEYGSPKIPLMKEAIAFHLIDMLDAKMAICDRALKAGINSDGLSEWSKELGGPLYKMTETQR